MEKFPKPSFLSEKVDIAEKPFSRGAFVKVVDFSTVKELGDKKISSDYVLKQYLFTEFGAGWDQLFEGDEMFEERTRCILLARQELLKTMPKGAEPLLKDIADNALERYKEIEKAYPEFREEKPEEYKEYVAWQVKLQDPEFVGKVVESWKLSGIAKRLGERNTKLLNYFTKQGLADIIVKTNFIVGAEKGEANENKDGIKHVYEIQPKIESVVLPQTLLDSMRSIYLGGPTLAASFGASGSYAPEKITIMIEESTEKLIGMLRETLSVEQLTQIRGEISALIPVAKELPIQTGILPPDILMIGNMLITKEGLRIIDTNLSVSVSKNSVPEWTVETVESGRIRSKENLEFYDQCYQRTIAVLEVLSKKLE